MSSFHPLGGSRGAGSADNNKHHPLAPAELRFHKDGDEDDDDSWSPPSLPGEPCISDRTNNRHGTLRRGSGAGSGLSSLETPLDPLLNTLPSPMSNTHGGVGGAYSAQQPQHHQQRRQQQQVQASSFSPPSGAGRARGEATAAGLSGPAGSAGAVLPGQGGGRAAAPREGLGGHPYAGTVV